MSFYDNTTLCINLFQLKAMSFLDLILIFLYLELYDFKLHVILKWKLFSRFKEYMFIGGKLKELLCQLFLFVHVYAVIYFPCGSYLQLVVETIVTKKCSNSITKRTASWSQNGKSEIKLHAEVFIIFIFFFIFGIILQALWSKSVRKITVML